MTYKHIIGPISNAIASQTTDKRQRSKAVTLEQFNNTRASRDRSQGRVASHAMTSTSRLPIHQPGPSALNVADNVTFEEEYGDERPDTDPLLVRIYSGIHYSRSQLRKNLPIMQTTHFIIPLPPNTPAEGTALVLLRRAKEDGLATFILEASFHIVFELGMPIPYVVPEGAGVRLVHDAQWWVERSPAEVKAGPHAEANDVRRAAGNLKALATRTEKKLEKSKRQRELDEKLKEGVRRQHAKQKMCDSDEDGERVRSDSETEVESEIGEDSARLD